VQHRLTFTALGLIFFACSAGPPVKTASGEIIEGVTYEERFPLSTDVNEVAFKGERLRKAVALMDTAQVIGMSGNFQSGEMVDKGTLLLTIRGQDGRERKILVKNCAEPHVCSFFAAAVKNEVVEKAPLVCRDGVRCLE
jgi:hypothetical protein